MVVSSHASSSYALRSQRAVRLAEEMAERTLAIPYGSIISLNGHEELPGQLRDIGGTLYPGDYQVFTRHVTTAPQTQAVSGLGGSVSGVQVTVTVTDAKGQSWEVARFAPAS